LHACLAGGERELERAEQIVGVGDRDRRHAVQLAELDQFLDPDRALGQRVGGVDPKMDEIGMRHGMTIPWHVLKCTRPI
jgi:hypothetical protein